MYIMKKLTFALLLIITTHFVPYVDADCLFPTELTGTWYSSAKGSLSISSSTTTSIPSYKTDKFGTLALTCNVSSGSNYVFKSDAFSYHGLEFESYICIVISRRISSKKYLYYLGSVENADADDERLKTYLVINAVTPTVADVCDRSSYNAGTEHIFLKNDGNELNSAIDCPFSIRAKQWEYNFTSTGSINTYCYSASGLNLCNSPNFKTLTFNYTACSTIQAYSATGILKCMWSSSDANYKYIHVYNTDSTTDESTTYRFTCYVLAKSGTMMYATQHPQRCLSTQTSTSVDSPGAALVFTRALECPYDSSSTVISTASAVGATLGVIFIIVIILCGVLVWYYYKKRKEREAIEKLPLQKAHPANKRLTNGDLYRDGRLRDSKTPGTMNGDCKVNIDFDPAIRRENSIHISMASRGGSGMGALEGPEPTMKIGPAPVEEPEKVNVNHISDDVIIESENEAALASTFLPRTPDERNELHFTDAEIREIERKDAEAKRKAKEEEDEEFNMDEIDDELGLPRLSRAFTPVMQPEEATLPSLAYKKRIEEETDSDDDIRADGIKKVKLKKRGKKKRRVLSSKGLKNRPKSALKPKAESFRETPFLERIKKVDSEKAELEHREKIEKEMKQIENEVIKARVSLGASSPATNKSKSSLRTQRPHELHPVVNTWWTEKEVKTFNQQIKDLSQQRRRLEKEGALETQSPIVQEKTEKEPHASDILWKYRQIMKRFRNKEKSSKKQKSSGKKKKGQGAGGGGATPKLSRSRQSKKTHLTTESIATQIHPLSLKPGAANLRLE